MRVPIFVAGKYFFSKNTRNAVNFISLISLIGFIAGTFALVVVLSVFNGFEEVINKLYNTYDPDVRITLNEGKFFEADDSALYKIKLQSFVADGAPVIEENGLVRYQGRQTIARIKGVEASYFHVTDLKDAITEGDPGRIKGRFCVMGRGLAAKLGVGFGGIEGCQIFLPDQHAEAMPGMQGGFREEVLIPTHEFSIQQELDGKTIIVPLELMALVAGNHAAYTSLEIKLKPGISAETASDRLQQLLGEKYICKDRFEQHETLNKIMHSEKRVSFILLVFILLIVSFNLTAGLIMLVLEKQDNIRTMMSFGASKTLIRRIFLTEGMLICVSGTLIGLLAGYIVCALQIEYGFIPIGDADTLVISSYPVALKASDFVYVALASLLTGYICCVVPSRRASRMEPGILS